MYINNAYLIDTKHLNDSDSIQISQYSYEIMQKQRKTMTIKVSVNKATFDR